MYKALLASFVLYVKISLEVTTMNIAIPIYGKRVMPRFGCTREIMIVSVEDGKIGPKKRLPIESQAFWLLPDLLVAEHVSVMICGGIHPRFQEAIQAQNIRLIWGVMGEWNDVLQAYLQGTLQTDSAFCLHHRGRRLHDGVRLRQGQHTRRE